MHTQRVTALPPRAQLLAGLGDPLPSGSAYSVTHGPYTPAGWQEEARPAPGERVLGCAEAVPL